MVRFVAWLILVGVLVPAASMKSTGEGSAQTATTEKYPSEFFTCAYTQMPASGKNDTLYDSVAANIKQHYSALSTDAEKQHFAACIVRTAGHDLMDFRYDMHGTARGGSDGCINLDEEDDKQGFSQYAQFERFPGSGAVLRGDLTRARSALTVSGSRGFLVLSLSLL